MNRYLHQISQLSKPIHFPKLRKSIVAAMEGLQSIQLLNIGKTSQSILIKLETADHVAIVEGVGVDLSDLVSAQVELSQVLELLEMLHFHDLVVGGVKDLEVFHGS